MRTVIRHRLNKLIAILLVTAILVFTFPQTGNASGPMPCEDAVIEHASISTDDCGNDDAQNNGSKNCVCCVAHCHDLKLTSAIPHPLYSQVSMPLPNGLYRDGTKSGIFFAIFEPPRLAV